MAIKWTHKIQAQGGQSPKVKKGAAIGIVNKDTEMNLKIGLQSNVDNLDAAVKEIMDQVGGDVEKINLVITGTETTLKKYVQTIQEIVATHGHQPSLEAYTKSDSSVVPVES